MNTKLIQTIAHVKTVADLTEAEHQALLELCKAGNILSKHREKSKYDRLISSSAFKKCGIEDGFGLLLFMLQCVTCNNRNFNRIQYMKSLMNFLERIKKNGDEIDGDWPVFDYFGRSGGVTQAHLQRYIQSDKW